MKKLVAGIVFGLASVYASFTGYSPTNYPNGLEVGNAISIDKTVGVLTINATALNLSGAASLGGTIAVDNILEKTSAHGVSVDGVLLKDGYGNFTGGNTADAPNLYLRSNAGIYSGGSGRVAMNSLGSGGYDAGYVDASGTFRINNIVTVNGAVDFKAKAVEVAGVTTANGAVNVVGNFVTITNAEAGAGAFRMGSVNNHPGLYSASDVPAMKIRGDSGVIIASSVQAAPYDVVVTGNRVGILKNAPETALDVAGTVSASALVVNGAITYPYGNYYLIGDIAPVTPNGVIVTFDNVVAQVGMVISTDSKTVIVGTAGTFKVTVKLEMIKGDSTYSEIAFFINGTQKTYSLFSNSVSVQSILDYYVVELNASDTIAVKAFTDGTTAQIRGYTTNSNRISTSLIVERIR